PSTSVRHVLSTPSSAHTRSSFPPYGHHDHRNLHSFPTRRSSDLHRQLLRARRGSIVAVEQDAGDRLSNLGPIAVRYLPRLDLSEDRKSTRLNSSHQIISYAVFCLKKKNKCH